MEEPDCVDIEVFVGVDIAKGDHYACAVSAAGGVHTCGLKTDATITCWGNNYYGQADAPAGTFSAVTAGGGVHTCGLKTDATIICWGGLNIRTADLGG